MMRTLLWKEYREHRIIWLAMMVVNSGVLIGLSRLDETFIAPRGEKLLMLGPIAALLVWGYAMICGAMLLAGEREEGTLGFLDLLPVSRFRLWLVKALIGLLLVGVQILVLYGCLATLHVSETPTLLNGTDLSHPLWPYLLGMLLLGIVGMAYGLFFSARGENALHTIGMAIIGQILAWIAAAFLAFAVEILWLLSIFWLADRQGRGPLFEGPILVFIVFGALTLAAIAGSARIFCRTDQQRLPAAVRRMRARASVIASWLRLIWLCDRQMRKLALGVLAFSLGMGVLFLVTGPLLWPIVTLFLGVLCGVTVFSDEQASGCFRFLGEQRLPMGRIWIIKTGMRFALLLLASFLILLPSLLVAIYNNADNHSGEQRLLVVIVQTLHLSLIVEVVPLASYLLLWLLYGFGAGQLCGLLSRKSIVAAMIALMVSASLAVVWVPSLAGIGLNLWQIAGPPLILLATAAFLIPAWAADRLASWRTYLRITGAAVGSLLWMAFGLWYRVIEIPDVPEPFDVAAYKASLPTMEENEAGQLIRGSWGRVEAVMRDMNQESRAPKKSLHQQCMEVAGKGWRDDKAELGKWLDKTFAENWLQQLAPLPDLPLGMVVNPGLLTQRDKELSRWHPASTLSMVLVARGLQQQARGDPAAFEEDMRIALALSRNLQHHAPPNIALFVGRNMARPWPAAVDLWLKELRGRPDLLKRALETFLDHEAKVPDEDEPRRADYLIAQNTLTQTPETLLADALQMHPKGNGEYRQTELQTAALLWLFPWEEARHRRLLRVAFQSNDREARKISQWGGRAFVVFLALHLFTQPRFQRERFSLREIANLHACQIKLALRLYQEENGDLPDTLAVLVPKYLKTIPSDPFDGRPFRYRLSRGEWIVWLEDNQGGPPAGMPEVPGEVPLMPQADGQVVPPKPDQPAPMANGGMPMPGAGMAARIDAGPPQEGFIFMPHAEDAEVPPPVRRRRRGGVMLPDGAPLPARFVPKGQGILWSVGDDGQDSGGKEQGITQHQASAGEDLIYLVPPQR